MDYYLRHYLNGKRGGAGVEYALVVGLIAVIGLVAVVTLGSTVQSLFSGVGNRLGNGADGAAGATAPAAPALPAVLSFTTSLPLNVNWTTGSAGSPTSASVTVRNNGNFSVTGMTAALQSTGQTNAANFSISGGNCTGTLAPAATCIYSLRAWAGAAGSYSDTLVVSAANAAPANAALIANASGTFATCPAAGSNAILCTTPGQYSWVVPAGVSSVRLIAIGGGAGGGPATATTGGGGGTGGAVCTQNFLSPQVGSALTLTVGAGGVGGVLGVPGYGGVSGAGGGGGSSRWRTVWSDATASGGFGVSSPGGGNASGGTNCWNGANVRVSWGGAGGSAAGATAFAGATAGGSGSQSFNLLPFPLSGFVRNSVVAGPGGSPSTGQTYNGGGGGGGVRINGSGGPGGSATGNGGAGYGGGGAGGGSTASTGAAGADGMVYIEWD